MKELHISMIVRRLLLFATIPILLVSLVLFSYTLVRNYQYNCSSMLSNETVVLRSVDDHIYSIEQESMNAVQSMDFLFFSNSGNRNTVTGIAERILSNLQKSLSVYDEAVGAVLYNAELDRSFRSCFSTDPHDQEILVGSTWLAPQAHRETSLTPVSTEDGLCFLYTVRERYGSLSVMIRLSDCESYRALCSVSQGELRFFTPEAVPADLHTITVSSDRTPLALSYEIPSFFSFTGLNTFQLVSLLVLVLLFAAVIFLFRYVQTILLSPLMELSASFQRVSEGDSAYRIGKSSPVKEINQFYTGFNAMLDSIRDAEEKTMRHQAEALQAKMQYLQMQIRPHFYLNCLKTINFLAQIHEDDKIQAIVISLSDYFRYSFQDVNRLVTIREELYSVGCYVELCRCLYSDIRLELAVPEEAMAVPCLPLSILTFVENCVKHRLDEDEILIRISASLSGEGEEARLLLRIQNSSRFSDEVVEALNAEQVNAFRYKSDKVGIANVRYRMWLLYQDEFALSFSNEGKLATVSLGFPAQVPPDQERRLL